jgi:adenylylsulfate kinase
MGTNLTKHNFSVSREQREQISGHKGKVLWFTGLSGSGKSTLANALDEKLNSKKYNTYILDGDNVRMGLNKDLGFSPEARKENIRRISEVAKLFADSGKIVMTAFISPYTNDRNEARKLIGDDFIEIFVNTSLDICIERDPKGLYKKAIAGEIKGFTGIDAPYQEPQNAEIEIKYMTIEESVNFILNKLKI